MLIEPVHKKPLQIRTPHTNRSVRRVIEKVTGFIDDYLDSSLDYHAEAVHFTGLEKFGKQAINTLYVGASSNYHFILDKIYGSHDILWRGDIRIWGASKYIKRFKNTVDLIVLDLPWPYNFLHNKKDYIEKFSRI